MIYIMDNKDNSIMEKHELIIPVDAKHAGNEIKVDLGCITIGSDGHFYDVKIDGRPAALVLGGEVSRLVLELDADENPKLTMTIIPKDLDAEIRDYKMALTEDGDEGFDDDFQPGVTENFVSPFSD